MATKKRTTTTEPKERATVSRERRLALSLKALLEAMEDADIKEDGQGIGAAVTDAELEAVATLNALGYGQLKGIPRQLSELEAELTAATEAKDYSKVAKLGLELERVKAGKSSKVVEGAE